MNCPNCGASLRQGARFCLSCGSNILPQGQGQPMQQAQPMQQGQPVQQGQSMQQGQPMQPQPDRAAQTARRFAGQYGAGVAGQTAMGAVSVAASAYPGEVSVGQFGGVLGAISQGARTARSMRGMAGRMSGTGKGQINKKKLIISIVVATLLLGLWITQYILSEKGIATDAWYMKVMNWLTFSSGGSGSFFTAFGGICGKAMVATGLCSLFNGGARSMLSGSKRIFSGKMFNKDMVCPILIGVGISMIFYQFFTGTGDIYGGMTAVSGIFVALRTLGGGGGIVSLLTGLIFKKNKKIQSFMQSSFRMGIATGMTFGYTLALPVAAIPYRWIHLVLGGALVLVVGILYLALKDMKKQKLR